MGRIHRSRSAVFTGAFALLVIYILSALPTPLYVVYQQQFGFSQIMLTMIYSAYVIGTVACMFFFGRLSDQIGRRPVVMASLVVAAIATLLFILAKSTVALFPPRILSGFGIALASGACTAWIIELEPQGNNKRATQLAIGANILGLGLGPLLGGVLAEYGPDPLRLCYWVFLALLPLTFILVARLPQPGKKTKPLSETSLKPRFGIPRKLRGRFAPAAIAAFATFAVMGFYTALIPTLLTQALHNHNHAIGGGIVAELFIAGAVAIAATPELDSRKGLLVSLALLLPGTAMMVGAELLRSMAVLISGTVLTGVASALAYRCSLEVVNDLAPEDRRSEMVSIYLIACYAGISLPVIGIGLLGKVTSSLLADGVFGAVVAAAAVIALIVEQKTKPAEEPRRRAA